MIKKIPVDNDFALNVLLRHMLKEMSVNESHMRSSIMMARAYNG